jgi:hypothetical protein
MTETMRLLIPLVPRRVLPPDLAIFHVETARISCPVSARPGTTAGGEDPPTPSMRPSMWSVLSKLAMYWAWHEDQAQKGSRS